MGVTPREFEELQPHEIRKLFQAHRQRQKDQDTRKAYFISWFVNTQVKKPISYTDILDPLYETPKSREQKIKDEHETLLSEFAGVLKKDKRYKI